MRMNEGALQDRGRGSADAAHFQVLPITPQLLAAQATTRATEKVRRDQPASPAVYDYRISPHDVLSVIVWEHPELTIPAGAFRSPETSGYTVSADGNIFFPNVGLVQVAGRTVEEVRVILTKELARSVVKPQLQVLVVAYRGKRVQVAGEVVQPSTVRITDVRLRLQAAIALARARTAVADVA